MFKIYGKGLALNSMEGSEAKHQAIFWYAFNTNFLNRWKQVFYHEFISPIWLQEKGYNLISASSCNKTYIPNRNFQSDHCYCGLPVADQRCEYCNSPCRTQITKSAQEMYVSTTKNGTEQRNRTIETVWRGYSAMSANSELFKTHAFCMILPWLHLFTYPAITSVGAVLKSDTSCESILQSESRLWLRLINRRIGRRLRIRNPYHAEMKIIQRSNCNSCRTLEWSVWEKRLLPSSHACMIFHTNPCQFRNFQTVLK